MVMLQPQTLVAAVPSQVAVVLEEQALLVS
jgi:hypothetical protein